MSALLSSLAQVGVEASQSEAAAAAVLFGGIFLTALWVYVLMR